jgi:gluconokinase
MKLQTVVVMGVAGAGKSTIGSALARALGATFLDADDFHPPENLAKMQRGIALGDADRKGWLAALRAELDRREALGERIVLACSALKQRYRDVLGLDAPDVDAPDPGKPARATVYLELSPDVATARLQARSEHFMPPSLVASQFEALEPPDHALRVDATLPVEVIVASVVEALTARS